MPVRLQHRGRTIPALRRINLATHPDYRRQGILTALSRGADREFGTEEGVVSFGFPNSSSLPTLRRTGAVELPYPLLIRPVAGLAREVGRRRRWAYPVGAAGQLAFNGLAATHRVVTNLGGVGGRSIEEFESFGPWADRLWEESASELGTCTIRDASYLNWRFWANPHDHTRVAITGPRDPECFAVTRTVRRSDHRLVVLMELIARPGDRQGARLLIDHVIREARADRAAGVVAVATRRHPFRRQLTQAGFLPASWSGSRNSFTARILGRGRALVPNELFRIDSWYLSAGDELETV